MDRKVLPVTFRQLSRHMATGMLRAFLLPSLLLVMLPCVLAQFVVQGRVVDERSQEPLAFVHVLPEGVREGGTTDINGRFSLEVAQPTVRLRFSYVGYAPLERMVEAGAPVLVQMVRAAVELQAVEILPGENPAHRIIDRVYANRKVNDGLRNRSHRYRSYSKTVFTAAVDSALLNDPERLATLDTNDREALDWLEKHHLLLIESATRRSFIPPANEKEEVLAMRVSGLKDPALLALAASTKTFSIYAPQIVLNDKNYLSPISPGCTDRYLFILQDTLYQGADTVFIISYQPRSGRRFDALKGALYVNTDGYALQNVIAEPVERSGGVSVKLQQQFQRVGGGGAWFPVQLNTFLYMDFVQVGSWRLLGVGRTYLKDIELDVDVTRREVRGPELVVEKMALRKDDEQWLGLREGPLDERDLRTYHVMDSLGEKFDLDLKLKFFAALATGRLPLGPVDLRLDRILHYNGYEGLRLGAGLATNDRISRYFSLGGYYAYGFGDRTAKYGGDLTVKPRPGRDLQLVLAHVDDVQESGGVLLPRTRPLLSNEGARFWFVDRMDRVERQSAELALRLSSSMKLWLGTERLQLQNLLGYQYVEQLTEDITYRRSRFSAGGLSATLRFAFREQQVQLPDRQLMIASRWPVLHVQVYKAVAGLWEGEEDLWRVNLLVDKMFRLRMLGDLSLRMMGGMAQSDAPYPFLFNLRGTFSERTPLAVNNSFETMRPNEFLADRYVALHVRHNFRNLLYKGRKWRPEPILVGNAAWGGLDGPALHEGYVFTGLQHGYYEAGLQIDNLLRMNTSGFGVGVFTRLGDHRLPREADNLAVKLTMSFAR
jgi:hypothetical protein